jgi:PhnB protein
MAKTPEGFHTITPTLVLDGAAKAIELYKKALGAEELYRLEGDKGKIMHACLTIGNSRIFLCDTNPQMGAGTPSQSSFYLYMDNVDNAASQAKGAGLTEQSPVQDMFWGDRTGSFKDSFGISWTLATHVREVSKEEMEEGRKKFASKKAA